MNQPGHGSPPYDVLPGSHTPHDPPGDPSDETPDDTSEQPPGPSRWREDLTAFVGIVVGSVLLGAPAGLLWSQVAPRVSVQVTDRGPVVNNLESTKAFIGADGSYLVVMFVLGLLCGALAWRFARRSGPFAVLALALGGTLAALVAASVGLRPGAHHALEALNPNSPFRGKVDLFLGVRHGNTLSLRARWAAVGWPVGACLAFLVAALQHPDALDYPDARGA